MDVEYRRWWSDRLGREMEYKVYGRQGKCLVYFPTQYNRFYEAEDRGIVHVLSRYIEEGRLMLVAVDSIDGESLSNFSWWDKHARLELQERYLSYVKDELIPSIHNDYWVWGRPYLLGMSFGAYQAMNLFLREARSFDGVFAFSGIYDVNYFTEGYSDYLSFLNCPIDFAYSLDDWGYVDEIRKKKILVVVSHGAWEERCIYETGRLQDALRSKGIDGEFYYWGSEFPHDWGSWHRYLEFYVPSIL